MVTSILVAVLFAAMTAILYFGFDQAERDRAERAAAEAQREKVHPPGRTADEVVFDLEHRIDSDLQDVATMLRSGAHPHRA
jgi:sensor domain CHASE-containing protein